MAVDANATRRQRAWGSIPDGASRTWSRRVRGSDYSLTLSNPSVRKLHETLAFSVDCKVTKDGALFFDDKINMPNPPVGIRNDDGTIEDNPRQALRESIIDVVRACTGGFTTPHLMRDADGNLLGDTLAVRSGTNDGRVSSANATWTTCLNGSTLAAATTGTAEDVRATWTGSAYQLRQVFLDFDTSSLGSTSTISNAIFTLYGNTTAESDTDNYDLQVRAYNWGGTLTTADWVDSNPQSNWTALTLMAHFDVGSWSQGSGNANNLTFDSHADVSKTGTTSVVVGLSALGSGTPTGANSLEFRLADQSGTTSDPLLTVTYTVPPSGTIAATLQKAVFSGSGAQTQTGTIAATLRKATASLTGAQIYTGTAAATMQKATFSGSGAQSAGTEGTIAASMQKATASLTGAMQPSGTVTANMQKTTFSGAATQTQTGTIAAALQKATASLSGSQVYTGTMAAALQKAVFSGAGAQTQTGTVAATMQKPTAALVGVMQPSGVIAVTMQKVTFSGAGLHQRTGALAAALTKATFAGAGTQIYTGTIAGTLRYLTFEGIAVIAKPGFAIVLDSYANGMRLLDQYADGVTLLDGYADGMTLFDLFADGITLADGYSNGVEVRDGGE